MKDYEETHRQLVRNSVELARRRWLKVANRLVDMLLSRGLIAALGWSILCLGPAYGFEESVSGSSQKGQSEERLKPSDEELSAWVQQLGSNEFQVREDAVNRLIRCDVSALKKIRKAGNESQDPEVRGRCHDIATAIYDVYLGERCREFLRGSGNDEGVSFRAWIPFSRVAGSGRLSRRMFVAMIEDYPDLMDSEFDDVASLKTTMDRISSETSDRFWRNEIIRVSDALALQLCSIQIRQLGGELRDDSQEVTARLVRTAPYARLLSQSAYQNTLKKLTGTWITSTTMPIENLLPLALEASVPDVIVRARSMLENDKLAPAEFELAMACVVRFGNMDDLPLVGKWCEVETVHSQHEYQRVQALTVPIDGEDIPGFNPGFRFAPSQLVEIRYQDIAIASSMKLAGKSDLRDFFPWYREHPLRVFYVPSLGFTEDETQLRQKAIDAWREQNKVAR